MLDLDDDESRKGVADPLLVEVVGLLLNDPVVAFDVEALAVGTVQVEIGRCGAEAAEVAGKMAVENHQWIARLRVFVEALGQEMPPIPEPEDTQYVKHVKSGE